MAWNSSHRRAAEAVDGSDEQETTGSAAGNSEAIRIYEAMEEERKRKLAAKAEAGKPKKVTLPRLKFMEGECR